MLQLPRENFHHLPDCRINHSSRNRATVFNPLDQSGVLSTDHPFLHAHHVVVY